MIELPVCTICWRMSLTLTPSVRVAFATACARATGSLRGADEEHVRARVVRHPLQVAKVRDHERVLRRRRELLHDPDHVEGDDAEAAAPVVEDAQPQQVSPPKRVVGDRLLRDQDPVGGRTQPVEHLRGATAEEVRVPQRRSACERRRIDAEGVLQVGADVRIGVVDGRDAGCAGQARERVQQPAARDGPGRGARDDVGAERQLGVDARLLLVGGDEDAQVDAEGEQEPEHEQSAIDRRPAPARAREQEPRRGRRASTRDPGGAPGDQPAAQADQQQRRAQPEQRRRQEHVDRKRQRRVRVRVDHGREAGPHGQPVDEPGDAEGENIEVEPLPERPSCATDATPSLADARAEGVETDADPSGCGSGGGE